MDNSSDKFLTKQELLLISESFAVSGVLVAMFDNCIIKTMPSDAESCEEQDGGKQYFVGQTTTKLQAVFHIYVAKNTERNENQRF